MQPEKLHKFSTTTLSTGTKIPIIGLGTYLLRGESGIRSITHALKSGYTHLDTATMYGNDAEIRKAIQLAGLKREQVYITSKVGPSQMGFKRALDVVEGMLKRLGCGYLDLILIHWPASYSYENGDKRNQEIRLETWKAFIQLQKEGKVRDIGVSNFLKHHLEHLLANTTHPPVINQIQAHPLLLQSPTIQYCKAHNITIEAYSPLAHNHKSLFTNKTLSSIAQKHNKTIAQICLRWGIQNGFVILPKSSNQKRIQENIDLFGFQLDEGDMGEILGLTKMGVRTDWDPNSVLY